MRDPSNIMIPAFLAVANKGLLKERMADGLLVLSKFQGPEKPKKSKK